MKLNNVEICNLNNEYLVKGKKSCESAIKFIKIFTYCLLGVPVIPVLIMLFSSSYRMGEIVTVVAVCLVFFILWSILANLFVKENLKAIKECDEEIEKRLKSKKISKNEVSDVLHKHTNEKKKNGMFLIAIIAFMAIIVICFKACDSKSNSFNDTFDKNPNEWTENEKDYVDGLFDWIDNNK